MSRSLWQLLIDTVSSDSIPLTCDECVAVMEYLAELGASGLNEGSLLAAAERHLAACSDCFPDFVQHLEKLELAKESDA